MRARWSITFRCDMRLTALPVILGRVGRSPDSPRHVMRAVVWSEVPGAMPGAGPTFHVWYLQLSGDW